MKKVITFKCTDILSRRGCQDVVLRNIKSQLLFIHSAIQKNLLSLEIFKNPKPKTCEMTLMTTCESEYTLKVTLDRDGFESDIWSQCCQPVGDWAFNNDLMGQEVYMLLEFFV